MKVRNVRRRQWRQWEYRRLPGYPRPRTPEGQKPHKPSITSTRWWRYKWPGAPRSRWPIWKDPYVPKDWYAPKR